MTGKELEAFVCAIERALLPTGCKIENRRREYGSAGTQIAEFDLFIAGKLGSANMTWLIECRDRPSEGPAPGSWIEQLVGRRDRFRFNKVMAVSSTGFAPGAAEYAKEAGIDVRSTVTISVDDVRDWLQAQELVFAEQSTELQHFKILIDATEPQEIADRAAQEVASHGSESAILFNPRTQQRVHPREAFLSLVNSHPELWPSSPHDGWTQKVTLHAMYRPSDRFVLQLGDRNVEIPEIVFEGELRVRVACVPFTQFIAYVDHASGERIGSSAAGIVEIGGNDYTLALDHAFDGDQSRVAVRLYKHE